LYNRVVTSYHKAKIERAALARELEDVKGRVFSFWLDFFLFDLA
jgi:hypothetical protein